MLKKINIAIGLALLWCLKYNKDYVLHLTILLIFINAYTLLNTREGFNAVARIVIDVNNLEGVPNTLSIQTGNKIIFKNNDSGETKTIVIDEVGTADIKPNDEFKIAIKKPGTYNYYCSDDSELVKKIYVMPPYYALDKSYYNDSGADFSEKYKKEYVKDVSTRWLSK